MHTVCIDVLVRIQLLCNECSQQGTSRQHAGTIRLCFARTPHCKLVVFVTTCDSADFHHEIMSCGFAAALGHPLIEHPVFKLHGDLDAATRTGAAPLTIAHDVHLSCRSVA